MKQINSNETLLSAIDNILTQHPSGITEFDLMSQLDNEYPALYPKPDLADPLLLFQHHFYLRHCLYQLQSRLSENRQGQLIITLTKLTKQPFSDQRNALGEVDHLRDYYLDMRNLNKEDQRSVNELLSSFWERMTSVKADPHSLRVLGLTGHESEQEKKQRYRALAQHHHPDKGGDEEHFQAIQAAWENIK